MKVFCARKLDELLQNPLIRASGVARLAGISAVTLSDIRKGKNEPKVNTLAGIAYALNKPLDYFLEDEDLVNQRKLALETKAAS